MKNWKVPLARPEITKGDLKYVRNVLITKQLANGNLADIFAREFARLHGFDNGLAFANGTLALECALETKLNDNWCYTTEFTFVATHNAIRRSSWDEPVMTQPVVTVDGAFCRIEDTRDLAPSRSVSVGVNVFGFAAGNDSHAGWIVTGKQR